MCIEHFKVFQYLRFFLGFYICCVLPFQASKGLDGKEKLAYGLDAELQQKKLKKEVTPDQGDWTNVMGRFPTIWQHILQAAAGDLLEEATAWLQALTAEPKKEDASVHEYLKNGVV